SGNAGQALTNVQVATFSDTYTGSTASDFEAIINWGDGTTTAGTVSGSGGAFTVDGSHTYADGGNFDVTVTAFDEPPGTAIATGAAAASINLATQMVLTSATEGTALPNTTPVATFSDGNLSDTASDFTASISWGDGTTSTGTVVGSNGSFTVEGGHTYTNYGSDYASVTLTNTATQSTASVSGSVTVADANNLTGQSITFSTPINFSGAVATFTDTYTGTPASEFNATIAWGDGFTSAGTVTGSNGSYTVSGSHNYEDGGQYTVTVQGADNAPGIATFSVTSTADVSFAGQLVLNSATEGTALPGTTAVATFSDFNPTDTASDFTATINWGDGVTTTGTVVGAPGTFTVEGGHTYANYGNDTASVTVTDTLDQIQGTFSGTVAVADANVLTGHGTTITANKGQAFTGTVATFTDTYTATPASEFLATINWGDGTTSTGTISGANGSFTVSGTHSYVDGGEYTVTVQGEDDPPGTATFSATSTAKVSLPSSFVGQNLSNYDFANQNLAGADFAGSNLSDADFANADLAGANLQGANMQGADLAGANLTNAVVTGVNLQNADLAGADLQGANLQGDNLQGAALQNANLQGVNLQGANLQGDNLLGADLQGADLQGANLQGDDLAGDNLVGADLQGANLQNADLQNADLQNANLTGANLQGANLQGANLQGAQGAGNADPPSTGPDSNIVLQDAPGTPVIWFMNGTSVTGDVVSFMNGTGGTSEVTSLPAPPSSWQLITTGDFAGNGNADLLWQNADGQVAIWMMNGTSIASAVAIATPPSSWHIVDTADFTGNGDSDILWQNSDGTPGIWIMNGTSIVSAVALPDPGSSWTVVGTGDFFGNDMADILLQNSNGTPMIWEMNGTSIVAEVTLPTPPSSWQIIGTGDFGNGQSDILWQNTDGQVAIWMMNGTSVASAVALTTPPSSWHFVGTADFTGNGIDDILWQNSDGTPGVWIMNGTTIVSAITLPNPNADPPASTAQASGAVVSPPPAVNGSPPAGQQGTGNGTWPGAFGSQWASSAPLWQGSGASGFGGGCSSSLLSGPTGASAPPLALRHG
ncbi:MAG TPA: pentapeptide repeat-containing protein, partial [Xanthobacteraceae bacterium]|nr:pentapeptide repeat-containing protein [Xanthobacteraceae bacterium]